MLIFSDAKPSADVSYLYHGIFWEAMSDKFQKLFGRKPSIRSEKEPISLKDVRVPDMIAESVDSNIASILTAAAVETSSNLTGTLPEINNATLLYSFVDNTPATITLAAVPEFNELDVDQELTLQALNDTTDIKVKDGEAYLSEELSTITVGIYVLNDEYAEEFQYRLSLLGGNDIATEQKKSTFDKLFSDLPGGEQRLSEDVEQKLLKVVGLNEYVTNKEEDIPEEKKAPGPAATAEEKTESLNPIEEFVKTNGYCWEKIARSLRTLIPISNDDIDDAEREYINYAVKNGNIIDSCMVSDNSYIEHGSIVTCSKYPSDVFEVLCMFGEYRNPDILIKNAKSSKQLIVNKTNVSSY